jgi:hypothetical protein
MSYVELLAISKLNELKNAQNDIFLRLNSMKIFMNLEIINVIKKIKIQSIYLINKMSITIFKS